MSKLEVRVLEITDRLRGCKNIITQVGGVGNGESGLQSSDLSVRDNFGLGQEAANSPQPTNVMMLTEP